MRILLALLLSSFLAAAEPPVEKEWTVEDVKRTAFVHVPATATTAETPVIFAFHGHGGTAKNVAAKWAYHTLWPEAIVVYPQGLPTATKNDPEGKRPGWQPGVGVEKDRDLKFFDAMLAGLNKDYKVDAKRIYCTGHSNGGGFTYNLWSARGDVFAAVAPSASGGRLKDLKPLPALHVAGEKDVTVPFENQQKTMEALKKLNGCDEKGEPWAKAGTLVGTLYPSKVGTPVVTVIYPGTHQFPAEAPGLIVKFFKEHAKK